MDCCTASDMPDSFRDSEHNPILIRSEFANTGSRYGLVLGRDVPVTIVLFKYDEATGTYSLSGKSWVKLALTFDEDLDIGTVVKAVAELNIQDAGQFDPEYVPGSGRDVLPNIDTSERFAAVFPEIELNKLAGMTWAMAELTADDNTLVSRCAFEVLGGQ
jgi:hypothetical protein